jgi:hypothetical protein
MATITINPDNSLSLNLNEEERSTFDGLPGGQLAEFVTIWLSERFKTVWKERVDRLTTKQKQDVLELLGVKLEAIEPTPVEPIRTT